MDRRVERPDVEMALMRADAAAPEPWTVHGLVSHDGRIALTIVDLTGRAVFRPAGRRPHDEEHQNAIFAAYARTDVRKLGRYVLDLEHRLADSHERYAMNCEGPGPCRCPVCTAVRAREASRG